MQCVVVSTVLMTLERTLLFVACSVIELVHVRHLRLPATQ